MGNGTIYSNPDPLNVWGWWGGWPMNELLVKALSPKWDFPILGYQGAGLELDFGLGLVNTLH